MLSYKFQCKSYYTIKVNKQEIFKKGVGITIKSKEATIQLKGNVALARYCLARFSKTIHSILNTRQRSLAVYRLLITRISITIYPLITRSITYSKNLVLLAFQKTVVIRMYINTHELSRHSTKTSKQASLITLSLTNMFLKKASNYLT